MSSSVFQRSPIIIVVDILNLIIVKIFRKLEFRTKFCLSLGKFLEFSGFLEFRSLAKNVEKKAALRFCKNAVLSYKK